MFRALSFATAGHNKSKGNTEERCMSDRVSGTVKWFNNAKGFGFITQEEGDDDVFVHFRSIVGDGYRTLNEGQSVEFTLVKGPKGLQAEDVAKL
jgi:CspA family cold shock protein